MKRSPGTGSAVLLAALVALLSAGCRGSDTTAQVKDGQKFSSSAPPANFVADMNRLRQNAPPPGPPPAVRPGGAPQTPR